MQRVVTEPLKAELHYMHRKKSDGKIKINYGALEYEDLSTNIINKVAINLDGGVESIKKRWKCYEKEFEINYR